MNPVTGTKRVDINGKGYTMRFTWAALAEVEAMYGDNPNLFNAEILSRVAAAGLRAFHPEMTPEAIMELSPPLIPFAKEVQQAMQWAYFGKEAIPEAKENVKKNLLMAGLSRLIKRLCRRESAPQISGT